MKTLSYFEKSVGVFRSTLPDIPQVLISFQIFVTAVDETMVFIWEGEVSAG